jgi:hypothetical protein
MQTQFVFAKKNALVDYLNNNLFYEFSPFKKMPVVKERLIKALLNQGIVIRVEPSSWRHGLVDENKKINRHDDRFVLASRIGEYTAYVDQNIEAINEQQRMEDEEDDRIFESLNVVLKTKDFGDMVCRLGIDHDGNFQIKNDGLVVFKEHLVDGEYERALAHFEGQIFGSRLFLEYQMMHI